MIEVPSSAQSVHSVPLMFSVELKMTLKTGVEAGSSARALSLVGHASN